MLSCLLVCVRVWTSRRVLLFSSFWNPQSFKPQMKEPQKIYLIGICGTAMASLAGMLREKGYSVCGSDSDVYPPMSDFLDQLGIPVFKGFAPENIRKSRPDLVVIGNALSRGN